jgi:hypothetical protein
MHAVVATVRMTQPAPANAVARPFPVITSTPSERDIGTTSYPRSVSTATTCWPTLPVAPATAIFGCGCMVCVLSPDLPVSVLN